MKPLEVIAPLLPGALILATLLAVWWGIRGGYTPGIQFIRSNRRSVTAWLIAVQVLFWAGILAGGLLKESASDLQDTGRRALGLTGIGSLEGFWQLTGGIWLWNTVTGLLLTTALPNLIAGLGALVVVIPRAFAVGVVLSSQTPAVLALHAVTILIEMSAYALLIPAGLSGLRALMTSEGQTGIMTLLRGRFRWAQVRASIAPMRAVLPLCLLLLLIGAWYEGVEIVYLIPAWAGR